MIVLDASAVVDFLVTADGPGDWATQRLSQVGSYHAPHLIDAEVTAAVRGHVLAGQLDAERGRSALLDYADIVITRYPALPLLARVWQLRTRISAYDAFYVALAEALDAPLVTTDLRLARSHGHAASIESPQ